MCASWLLLLHYIIHICVLMIFCFLGIIIVAIFSFESIMKTCMSKERKPNRFKETQFLQDLVKMGKPKACKI